MFGAAMRLAEDPEFPVAARALAGGMLALAARDAALDSIFKDAGRYFAAMWGFALHDDGGLTLPRLKAICAKSGLLSPGRVRAQVHFLEHFGYLAPGPGEATRATVYVPTPTFVAAWDRQFVAALEAVRPIAPDVEKLLAPHAAVRQTYGRIHASGYLTALQADTPIPAFLRVFLHPYAGNHILWVLLTSGDGPEFPPERAGPVSIKALATRAGVARIQVARILRMAAAEDLAHLGPDGYVRFQPAARKELGFFYAIQLVQILAAAAQAARAHGLIGQG